MTRFLLGTVFAVGVVVLSVELASSTLAAPFGLLVAAVGAALIIGTERAS